MFPMFPGAHSASLNSLAPIVELIEKDEMARWRPRVILESPNVQ
jgi:hypothetical protein